MKTLFINGKISSLDEKCNFYESLGVNDKFIDFLGTNQEARTIMGEYNKVIDLEGNIMIPGFNDSHMHLLNYGYTLEKLNLTKFDSIEDMLSAGRKFILDRTISKDNWLLCRGWNQDTVVEKRFPTKEDLDKISKDVPILFTRICGHIGICNSKALTLIDKNSIDTHDKNINLKTGTFQEDALFLLQVAIPSPSIDDIKRMIQNSCKDLIRNGVTSVQSDDLKAMPDQDYNKVLKAFFELREEGNLPIRIYQQCLFTNKKEFKTFVDQGYKTGQGDDFFKIGPLKLLLDGSLGGRTALLRSDYNDAQGVRGVGAFDQDELNELFDYAQMMKFQVAAHAIGDKAMDMILDSIENSPHIDPSKNYRHGIVHCQITDLKILQRMKKNHILAYIQPIFLDYDLHIVKDRVGDRALDSYAFKTMDTLGIKICIGTDSPVVDINPFENIYSAVMRKDLKGMPDEPYLPDERLTITQTLKSYTSNCAYSSFEEDLKGTLEIGKLADMVVIDKDIFMTDPNYIKEIKVKMTIIDGNIIHRA